VTNEVAIVTCIVGEAIELIGGKPSRFIEAEEIKA